MENVDWAALPFNYHKTDYNVRNSYKAVSYTHLTLPTIA